MEKINLLFGGVTSTVCLCTKKDRKPKSLHHTEPLLLAQTDTENKKQISEMMLNTLQTMEKINLFGGVTSTSTSTNLYQEK